MPYVSTQEFIDSMPDVSIQGIIDRWCSTTSSPEQRTNEEKRVKCSCCGSPFHKSFVVKCSNGRYVCRECMRTKPYSTKNNNTNHAPKKNGKTYGFELECVPNSAEDKASVISSGYGFIPTRDGSLPLNGVEFKTPTYFGLSGIKKMLKNVEKYVSFSSPRCGQHINIGDYNTIGAEEMQNIRSYGYNIFYPVQSYMEEHRSATKRICGRYFVRYANTNTSYVHGSWVNLSHDNRIEFRISKYRTAEQYVHLCCMWTEMLDCIEKNFLKNPCQKTADKTGIKMVKIFKKYSEGKANCQRPERNKV